MGRTEVVVGDAEVEERGRGALDVDAALVVSLGKPRDVNKSLRERQRRAHLCGHDVTLLEVLRALLEALHGLHLCGINRGGLCGR